MGTKNRVTLYEYAWMREFKEKNEWQILNYNRLIDYCDTTV